MSLKRITNKVEILDIDGTKIYATKPDKAKWDEYTDSLFERVGDGEIKVRSSEGIRTLYRLCVSKIENVEVEKEGQIVSVPALTDPSEIVDFLSHLNDLEAGRKIDSWLLGLGDLTKTEAKNLNGAAVAS